jgi:hypothetical protein
MSEKWEYNIYEPSNKGENARCFIQVKDKSRIIGNDIRKKDAQSIVHEHNTYQDLVKSLEGDALDEALRILELEQPDIKKIKSLIKYKNSLMMQALSEARK